MYVSKFVQGTFRDLQTRVWQETWMGGGPWSLWAIICLVLTGSPRLAGDRACPHPRASPAGWRMEVEHHQFPRCSEFWRLSPRCWKIVPQKVTDFEGCLVGWKKLLDSGLTENIMIKSWGSGAVILGLNLALPVIICVPLHSVPWIPHL